MAGYYGYLVGLDKQFVWDKFIPERNLQYAAKVVVRDSPRKPVAGVPAVPAPHLPFHIDAPLDFSIDLFAYRLEVGL